MSTQLRTEGPGFQAHLVETVPSTLMATGACKILSGCNVLQDSIQNYTCGDIKEGKPSPPWRVKIGMGCLRIILRDESQTVGSSPLRSSGPTLKTPNPTQFILQLFSVSENYILP